MRTWRGIGIISTMRSTRLWDCRLGVGWSRVRVSGSSNSASREWGCAGVRLDLTICYISDSPGSTARLRRCFRYSSNHPPTRNYAQFSVDLSVDSHDPLHRTHGQIGCAPQTPNAETARIGMTLLQVINLKHHREP